MTAKIKAVSILKSSRIADKRIYFLRSCQGGEGRGLPWRLFIGFFGLSMSVLHRLLPIFTRE